ncbi:hypothetical protein EBZ39_04995 [bacterium]|nr:hypothetical protein [bacterium]
MRTILVALFLVCGSQAFGQNCLNGQCRLAQTRAYTTYVPNNSTAQGAAEIQANRCSMGHVGGNHGYEGVGMGSTPEEALNRCCYSRSGMRVVDQGVARGRNGKWYACKRYR